MHKPVVYTLSLLLSAFIALPGKAAEPIHPKPAIETTADSSAYTVEKLYEGFKNPWGMAWLPDGRLLITERAGEILIFKNNKFTGEKLSGVPKVFAEGQGGLLDIKLHPDYAKNKWI